MSTLYRRPRSLVSRSLIIHNADGTVIQLYYATKRYNYITKTRVLETYMKVKEKLEV